MSKKAAFVVILLILFGSLTAFAAGEETPKRVIEPFAPAKLDAERLPARPATFRPISGTPIEIRTGEVETGKDFCDLTGAAVYFIPDWYQGLEWYANYQNPEEFGCVDVWPFQVTQICFQILTDNPMTLNVQGLLFENAGPPECPVPGDVVLCETPLIEVDIASAGYWEIALSVLPDTCCVNRPYFAAIYIADDLTGSGTDPVSGADGLECQSYMNRGAGWEDLVLDYGWPGQMMLFSKGFTDPQNPCDTSTQEPCEEPLVTLWGGPYAYYWWGQPPRHPPPTEFLNMRFEMPSDLGGRLDKIAVAFYDASTDGTPDPDLYVWLSDGLYPLDSNPPLGAIAEFHVPFPEITWYPTYHEIDCYDLGIMFDPGDMFHIGGGHAYEPGDTLAWISDDGSYNSDRASNWDGDAWTSIYDYPEVQLLINAYICPAQEPEGCCWWYVDGGPETDCTSPVTAAECADLGGNFIPDATCNTVTGRCDVPHTVIVEPNDTSIWDKNYFSDTLTIQAVDFPSGPDFPAESFFDVYVEVPVPEWIPIGHDTDGTTYMQDPYDPTQPGGDGWQTKWHPGELPEGYYMIRATLVDSSGRSTSDTIVQYWDPYPPEVDVIFPEVFNFPAEGGLDIQFFTPGDNITEMYVIVYRIPDYPGPGKAGGEKFDCIQGFNKGVPHFNQHNLYPDGSDGNNRGCSPTSMAACLKYWADNGFPCLNDNGAMSDADMVSEIAGFAGTHPDFGTDLKAKKAAIEAYIKKHCGECVFQPVEHLQGNDVTIRRLIRELFEEDEDVITGDRNHVTVVNSFCVHPKRFIDYMDPWTGTEVNGPMDVDSGFGGNPLLELVIVSPKEATQPVPSETVATTDEIEPVPEAPPGTYHYPWHPDPELFPVGSGYFVNVEITDGLGHKGWDLVKIELFIRGDATGDAIIDVGDVVFLVNYLYRNGVPPFPEDAGDANCDGIVNVGDVVYTVNYLFRNGDPPGCD